MKCSFPSCICPPAPELYNKIVRTKRLLKSGADLTQPRADALSLVSLMKILSRPPATRAHTLVAPVLAFKPVTGARKALVLVVDFSDKPATRPVSHYRQLLFSKKSYPTGSMRDYYQEVSYGRLDIQGAVNADTNDTTVWLRAPQPYSYYADNQNGFGSYPKNAQRLVEDAVNLAKDEIDFSQYDIDGDGFVDALFVVHAGPGAEVTGKEADIWSHQWTLPTPLKVDGVKVSTYSIEPEDGEIGVFCHELGHVFGLPDLYDTGYDSAGIGRGGVMGGGSWNNGGRTPAHFSAWSTVMLGWVSPEPVFNEAKSLTLAPAEKVPQIVKLPIKSKSSREYFLLENRRKTGFDLHLPGEGLLIWHVDDNLSNNSDQTHFLAGVVQADGKMDLEKNANQGDDGDPFGKTNPAFGPATAPSSRAYDGSDSGVALHNIKLSGEQVTLEARVGQVGGRLSDRPVSDLIGIDKKLAASLEKNKAKTIDQLAESDPFKLAAKLPLDPMKIYPIWARARLVKALSVEIPAAIRDKKVPEVLAAAAKALATETGSTVEKIDFLKGRLAELTLALDGSVVKRLTLGEIG